MDLESKYVYKKEVDKSMLKEGIGIPISFQPLFQLRYEHQLKRGESRSIKLSIEGRQYDATLKNQIFNQEKYRNHADILQIRYTESSGIPGAFRKIFKYSIEYISRNEKPEKKEYLAIYITDDPFVFITEAVTIQELSDAAQLVYSYPELELETLLEMADEFAGIVREARFQNIRRLDREIGNSLKIHYKYRCQICGQDIGRQYDVNVAHSHHIDPFSTSLNNNSNNIMIVCPNHHNVIHAANPAFDRTLKIFQYNNGLREGLILNNHI